METVVATLQVGAFTAEKGFDNRKRLAELLESDPDRRELDAVALVLRLLPAGAYAEDETAS